MHRHVPTRRRSRSARHGRSVVVVATTAIVVATGIAAVVSASSDGRPRSVATAVDPADDDRSPVVGPRADGGEAAAATEVADLDAGGIDPGLAAALDAARDSAADDGIHLVVNDTYRSAEEQTRLFEEEVVRTGSVDAALGRVFPADRSMHVRGLAVDIGSGPAADWLAAHGRDLGLCRTLDWEWWHFEWRAAWQRAASCPAPATGPEDAPIA